MSRKSAVAVTTETTAHPTAGHMTYTQAHLGVHEKHCSLILLSQLKLLFFRMKKLRLYYQLTLKLVISSGKELFQRYLYLYLVWQRHKSYKLIQIVRKWLCCFGNQDIEKVMVLCVHQFQHLLYLLFCKYMSRVRLSTNRDVALGIVSASFSSQQVISARFMLN